MKSSETYRLYLDGRHYDRMFPRGPDAAQYWCQLAADTRGPILELACGTGAIAIPLAAAGHEVTGIDASPQMLAEGMRKAEESNIALQWRVADMRDFRLGREFGLIILAANTICHLLELASLEACLSCVRAHLSPQGRFVIHVFVPRQDVLRRESRERELFAEYEDPDGGGKAVIEYTYRYEPDTQIKRITTYHRLGDGSGETTGALDMRMYYPQELDALLKYNGLRIVEKCGDVNGGAFDSDAQQQVIVSALA